MERVQRLPPQIPVVPLVKIVPHAIRAGRRRPDWKKVSLLRSRAQPRIRYILSTVSFGLLCLQVGSCRFSQPPVEPSIEFSRVPPAEEGSPDTLHTIEGRVRGAQPGQRIVLFARAGMWWVQPLGDHPFTAIQPDSTWKNSTHPGTTYAALLVDSRYHPPLTANSLPGERRPRTGRGHRRRKQAAPHIASVQWVSVGDPGNCGRHCGNHEPL